jgi:hypothetical protein
MKTLFWIILICPSFSFADDVVLKGHFFEGDKKSVNFMKGNEVSKFEKKPSLLPDRDKRENAFKEADVVKEIQKMDEVDRDIFYYKTKEYSLETLKKEYPSISVEKLKKLKNL